MVADKPSLLRRITAHSRQARWVAVCTAAFLSAGVSHADTRDPVTADALFREARELLKAKNYAAACPKLAESYRLDPAPGTLYNLADCEEKEGKIASALQRWQSLVDLLTTSKKMIDPRLPAARRHVDDLLVRVPRLELRYKRSPSPDAIVLRDGIELRGASLEVSLPVEPGKHQVIVRAPYRRDNVLEFSIQEGERKVISLEEGPPDGTEPKPVASAAVSAAPPPPVAPASAAPPPSPPPAAPVLTATAPSNRRTLGLVIGGAGVAALIGAGATSLVLRGYRSTVEDHCDLAAHQCDDAGYDAARSGTKLAPINLALWIVGAASTGAGAYLFLTAPQPAQTGQTASPPMLWMRGAF